MDEVVKDVVFKVYGEDDEAINFACDIAECASTFSDETGKSNQDKWFFVAQVLQTPGANILSPFPFQEIYGTDNPRLALAGMYVAELRGQVFTKMLDRDFGTEALNHLFYVISQQWQVRFRERLNLAELSRGHLLN